MNIVSLKPRVFKRDKNSCGAALPYALMPLNSITPRSGEETREEKSHLIPFRAHFVKLHDIYESTRGASIIPFPSALAPGPITEILYLKRCNRNATITGP